MEHVAIGILGGVAVLTMLLWFNESKELRKELREIRKAVEDLDRPL